MIDPTNPYHPPTEPSVPSDRSAKHPRRTDSLAFAAWPIVFGMNLIIPLLFGWSTTEGMGRTGMIATCVLFLFGGWCLCFSRPQWARKLMFGSIIVAITQIMPIIHVVVGIIAVTIALELGLAVDANDQQMEIIPTLAGGIFVTLLTGCTLASCAAVLGWLCGLVLPARWFNQPTRD